MCSTARNVLMQCESTLRLRLLLLLLAPCAMFYQNKNRHFLRNANLSPS